MPESESGFLNFLTLESESHKKTKTLHPWLMSSESDNSAVTRNEIAFCYYGKITKEDNAVIKTLRLDKSWSSWRPTKELPCTEGMVQNQP